MNPRIRPRRPASIGSNQASPANSPCSAAALLLSLSMAWSPPALERRSWLVTQAGDYATQISHHTRDGTSFGLRMVKVFTPPGCRPASTLLPSDSRPTSCSTHEPGLGHGAFPNGHRGPGRRGHGRGKLEARPVRGPTPGRDEARDHLRSSRARYWLGCRASPPHLPLSGTLMDSGRRAG